jgi:drug/metabolite transporter (DMT)-like permease
VGLPFAFGDWSMPDLGGLVLFVLLGLTGVGAQSAYVRALSTGEVSLMGLIDYVRLPLAILAGLILFHEVPDQMAMLGAAVVIASTLYITWRESRVKKEAPLSGTAP